MSSHIIERFFPCWCLRTAVVESFDQPLNWEYGFLCRLIEADFGQHTDFSNCDKSAGVDYTSYMGNGNYMDSTVNAYDLNGSILTMTQRGVWQ